MASWTSPVIHATADTLAVQDYNNVAENTIFLYQAPYGRYINGSPSLLTFDSPSPISLTGSGSYGMALAGDAIQVPIAGLYQVVGQVATAGTGGTIQAYLYQGGGLYSVGPNVPLLASGSAGNISDMMVITNPSTQTIGLAGLQTQTSGGNTETIAEPYATFLGAYFVGSV